MYQAHDRSNAPHLKQNLLYLFYRTAVGHETEYTVKNSSRMFSAVSVQVSLMLAC